MKRIAITRNPISRLRHSYTKVLDARKLPVRHLNRRNSAYYARLMIEDESGRKKMALVPLAVQTTSQAREELRRLLVQH